MADESKVLLQRVRFTGKRTGLESIVVKGFGRVHTGQTFEVLVPVAEQYTAPLPMRDGKEGSDFAKVGDEFSVPESELVERREAVMARLAERRESEPVELPADVNADPAHEVAEDQGTVEEYAEVVAAPVEETGADEPKKGRPKKA